jgi:hypothetical protein
MGRANGPLCAGSAGSTGSAGSAGLASLDLIPVEINTTLVLTLTLTSLSGFLSIFFVGLVNVAMVDFTKILFCFIFVS